MEQLGSVGIERRSPKVLGMPIFDYLAQHPAHAEEFSAGMNSITSLWRSTS
jgi:hypothetical protein